MFIQQVAGRRGMCVTISPQSYIYTGGRQEGFRIGFINYPRFPKEPDDIFKEAKVLADWLRDHIGQDSYSIVTPHETVWVYERAEFSPPLSSSYQDHVFACAHDMLAVLKTIQKIGVLNPTNSSSVHKTVLDMNAIIAKAEGLS